MRVESWDREFPLGTTVLFADGTCSEVAAGLNAFNDQLYFPMRFKVRRLEASSLSEAVARLPSPSMNDVYYVLPTATDWSAVLQVRVNGMDVSTTPHVISGFGKMRVCLARSIRDTVREHSRDAGIPLKYGSVRFSLYKEGKIVRNVHAMNEGTGRWGFETYGQPLASEELANYQRKIIRERFTVDDLERLLENEFAIRYRDASFYNPKGGILVELREKLFGFI